MLRRFFSSGLLNVFSSMPLYLESKFAPVSIVII